MTSSRNTVRRAVRHALFASAVAASGSMNAMAADEVAASTLDKVVVTGSRIASANVESVSPITTMTSEDIASQGVTRIEDLINQLPQAFAAQNASVSNGSTGTATINLRGLGSARTLVLIDGRRMPYGGVSNSAADINQIPAAMVERVEVLTGGASAVYGSDAIGGVVNFIMKKDFEGVQFDAMYGFYQHSNGYEGPGQVKLRDTIAQRGQTNPEQFKLPDDNVTDGDALEFNLTLGVSTEDGRGNITAFVGVRDNKEVMQADRDYSACSLSANPKPSFKCGGSATSYPGYFYMPAGIFTINQATGNTFTPYDANVNAYNFGPLNHYQRPDTRYTLGAMGHYEIAEAADVYTQLMFTNYESVAQIAPGGNFFDSQTINCDNPFLSAGQLADLACGGPGTTATLYMARRNVEGGGRQQRFENNSFRVVTGLRGHFAEHWDYDASAQYSAVTADQSANNYFHKTRLIRALDAVIDPLTGAPACRSFVDGTDPNCAPYNPFQIGGVTDAALKYLQVPGMQQGKITQQIYNVQVTGDLGGYGLTIPFASDSIKVLVGAEKRFDDLENVTDDPTAQFLLSGTGGPTPGISGATQVIDLYTEVQLPLVQGKPFAEQLGVELAFRHSAYDAWTSETEALDTDTYKIGADWAPIADVRLRASYQRAIRAPNVVELFTAEGFNLFDLPGDPCGTDLIGTAGEATRAQCLATGVPAAVFDGPGRAALDSPAGQYNFLQGGEVTLVPEESDTYTVGVVFQPRFLAGLTLSIDYFNIEITDSLTPRGPDTTIKGCYRGQDAASCALIRRDPTNGSLWRGEGNVIDLNTNIGSLTTKGWDLSVAYAGLSLGGLGELDFALQGTFLDALTYVTGVPGNEETDCVGKFSGALCGVPSPEWRHHFRIGWQSPWDVDVGLTWRYYDSVTNIDKETTAANIDYVLDAKSYFDLSANWAVTEKANIIAGINNVLDNDPPLSSAVGTTGNGNTYPQTYDAMGRWIFVRAQLKF